jgi:FkbM family methyltransferase
MKKFTYNKKEYDVYINTNDPSGEGCITEIVKNNEYKLEKYEDLTADILDIGANCGIATIILARQNPNSTIYSFEPHKPTYNLLVENVKLNKLSNVKTFNLAVSDVSDKTIQLYVSPLWSGANTTCSDPKSFAEYNKKESVLQEVQCISLDKIISDNNIVNIKVLKIDCEGAEFEIIYGSEKFKEGIVENIIGEFHDLIYNTNSANDSNKLIEYCKQYTKYISVSILKI